MNFLIEMFESSRRWVLFVAVLLLAVFLFNFTILQKDWGGGLSIMFVGIFSNLLPAYYLIRYTIAVKSANNSRNPNEELEDACLYQAFYFRAIGIFYAIIFVFLTLGIVRFISLIIANKLL